MTTARIEQVVSVRGEVEPQLQAAATALEGRLDEAREQAEQLSQAFTALSPNGLSDTEMAALASANALAENRAEAARLKAELADMSPDDDGFGALSDSLANNNAEFADLRGNVQGNTTAMAGGVGATNAMSGAMGALGGQAGRAAGALGPLSGVITALPPHALAAVGALVLLGSAAKALVDNLTEAYKLEESAALSFPLVDRTTVQDFENFSRVLEGISGEDLLGEAQSIEEAFSALQRGDVAAARGFALLGLSGQDLEAAGDSLERYKLVYEAVRATGAESLIGDEALTALGLQGSALEALTHDVEEYQDALDAVAQNKVVDEDGIAAAKTFDEAIKSLQYTFGDLLVELQPVGIFLADMLTTIVNLVRSIVNLGRVIANPFDTENWSRLGDSLVDTFTDPAYVREQERMAREARRADLSDGGGVGSGSNVLSLNDANRASFFEASRQQLAIDRAEQQGTSIGAERGIIDNSNNVNVQIGQLEVREEADVNALATNIALEMRR